MRRKSPNRWSFVTIGRMTKREQLIQWLSDAHAMEVGIASTLEKHAADAKDQPKVRAAINKHLKETKRHAADLEKVLSSLGSGPAILKEGISKLANLLAGLATSAANDTVIKNGIADFATEHFEIACYNSLIFTATELGEAKVATVCRGILKDEKAMAKLLEGQLKEVNAFYLKRLEDDAEPKQDSGREAKAPKRKQTNLAKAGKRRPNSRK